MKIQVLTKNDKRIYPAKVYSLNSGVEFNSIEEILDSIDRDGKIKVEGDMYSIFGQFIEVFSGTIMKDELLSMININEDNFGLDKVFTLKEAAKKWFLADGITIRRAIERKKFKSGEIKQSGSVWLVTSEAMERVFGPMGVNNCYAINKKELFSILSKVYLKDIKEAFMNLSDRDKEILEGMESKAINIFIDGYRNLRDGKVVVISNGTKEKPWQIINSFEDLMLFLGILEKKRLLTEDRKINIISYILTM
jgi:hypothetical protein